MVAAGKGRNSANPNKIGCIRTTLYGLIQAVNEEVGSDQDALVVSIVMNLVQFGKVKWINYPTQLEKSIHWH